MDEMKNSAIFKNWGTFKKEMNAHGIALSFANHLEYSLSKDQYTATFWDLYYSLALSVRDRLIERWIRTQQMYYDNDVKRVYYLSAEYLMGRALMNNLINLQMYRVTVEAMNELHIDLDTLSSQEPDMGLGNGGLGRLAACFLDSLATLEIPACGYGLRYEFGIFDQIIRENAQVELPDTWLKHGNPWELVRPERSAIVKYYGNVEEVYLPDGRIKAKWKNTSDVIGIPYDIPVAGFGNTTVNTLRLWASRATNEFDLEYFQHGDYLKAVEEKNISENISKVLYPNDQFFVGRELRLRQEYFFVSCSIQDIVRRYLVNHETFDSFADKVVIQMNDTHPALAIVELMRVLIDEYDLGWEKAWEITKQSCAFTNHTLLSEALEKWPVGMFGNLLPRHLTIIYEINRRFLREVSVQFIDDEARLKRMSIFEEDGEKSIRMAHLATIGSHSVNGVAELHTRLLKENVLKDFYEMYPDRFNNKTNGITPRRWLMVANPRLTDLINSSIGQSWQTNLHEIKKLEKFAEDASFQEKWAIIKLKNKEQLAGIVSELTDMYIDPTSMFDIQVKRIHEYKRQLMNIIHVIYRWLELKETPNEEVPSRTFIFGGKAAPGYIVAKNIIRLICSVADVINEDRKTNEKIKVVFLPNYRVSLAEKIFPGAEVSEQISTAGFEASGTSNMKFALNGALTVGTYDGANIEMLEEIGEDNMFIFGNDAAQVEQLRSNYDPKAFYSADPILKKTIDLIYKGFFNPDKPDQFQPLVNSLLEIDYFMIFADFQAYRQCHKNVDALYRNTSEWTKKSILNVARTGRFSSDSTIKEYNRDIWKVKPLSIPRENRSLELECVTAG